MNYKEIVKFCDAHNLVIDEIEYLIGGKWYKGVNVLDRSLPGLPEGVYKYAVRHSDFDTEEPKTLERFVVVNRFGWFLTTTNLGQLLEGKEYVEIEDWNYL